MTGGVYRDGPVAGCHLDVPVDMFFWLEFFHQQRKCGKVPPALLPPAEEVRQGPARIAIPRMHPRFPGDQGQGGAACVPGRPRLRHAPVVPALSADGPGRLYPLRTRLAVAGTLVGSMALVSCRRLGVSGRDEAGRAGDEALAAATGSSCSYCCY